MYLGALISFLLAAISKLVALQNIDYDVSLITDCVFFCIDVKNFSQIFTLHIQRGEPYVAFSQNYQTYFSRLSATCRTLDTFQNLVLASVPSSSKVITLMRSKTFRPSTICLLQVNDICTIFIALLIRALFQRENSDRNRNRIPHKRICRNNFQFLVKWLFRNCICHQN